MRFDELIDEWILIDQIKTSCQISLIMWCQARMDDVGYVDNIVCVIDNLIDHSHPCNSSQIFDDESDFFSSSTNRRRIVAKKWPQKVTSQLHYWAYTMYTRFIYQPHSPLMVFAPCGDWWKFCPNGRFARWQVVAQNAIQLNKRLKLTLQSVYQTP